MAGHLSGCAAGGDPRFCQAACDSRGHITLSVGCSAGMSSMPSPSFHGLYLFLYLHVSAAAGLSALGPVIVCCGALAVGRQKWLAAWAGQPSKTLCLLQMAQTGAAVLGVPVKPTIKEVDAVGNVLKTLKRAALVEVQTPQVPCD